jgi:bifunctional UDP-N-acetylglucosamine pyrophosphorylase/glucosamine-1-phosphate N-acetyltransferase
MTDAATDRPFLAVVLGAGEGTRMRSRRPKVLHEIAGRSMLAHVLAAVKGAGAAEVGVVVGPGHDAVRREVEAMAPGVRVFEQTERLGTAHAVLALRDMLRADADCLVLFADTPLVRNETLSRLTAALREGAAVAVLGFEAADPFGYGRLIVDEAGRKRTPATPSGRSSSAMPA